MKLQALLFDIDGTLIDSNDVHARCWREAFAHFGKEFSFEVIRSQIGKGGDLLVPDLLQARDIRKFGKELKEFRSRHFKEHYMPHLRPFAGIPELLQTVHRRGIRIAFASSANEDEVDFYIGLLQAKDLIEGATSKADSRFSKPYPGIFEAALDRAGSKPEWTFVVGDTPYDILAAHRIPLPIAAVRCGGFDPELLSKAEFLFDDVADLVANLGEVEEYLTHE